MDFYGSSQFGDEALSGLSEAMKSLACLQEINLRLLWEDISLKILNE